MNEIPLIVMAKPPEKGRVKTRLAQTIGDADALEVYTQLLNRSLRIALDSRLKTAVHWAFSSEQAHSSFPDLFQEGKNLGERMLHAFQQHGSGPRLMIGTDCPHLDTDIIHEAAEALLSHDVVFGPAKDGGYYLIGIKGDRNELFRHIPWSTESVLLESLKVCKQKGWKIKSLKTLGDIDTFDDLLDEGFMPELASRHQPN